MTKKYLNILLLILVVFIGSCSNETESINTNEQPVVQVFDSYLYSSDIQNIIPQGVNVTDSANISQTYINNWIQNKIMLHYANDYLTNQLDDIDKKTQDFKQSLMIHKFEDELVAINSDSVISNDQINVYYNTHVNEFKLTNSIIKGFFVMMPINTPDINIFISKLKQSTQDDIDEILSCTNSSSGFFEDFTHNWNDFSEKIMKLPYAVPNEIYFLNTNKYAEAQDDSYFYFLYISNYIPKGEIAPIEYVSSNIKQILLQTQTNQIINQFKQEKYDEAMQQGNIIFYN